MGKQPDRVRLRKLRKSGPLTQDEAADACGLHVRSYQRLESGETDPVRPAYFAAVEHAVKKKHGAT